MLQIINRYDSIKIQALAVLFFSQKTERERDHFPVIHENIMSSVKPEEMRKITINT